MDQYQDNHNRRRNAPQSTSASLSANGSTLMPMEADLMSTLHPRGQAREFKSPRLMMSKAYKAVHAVVHTSPAWLNFGIMIGLIFGGCCSNVRHTQRLGMSF